VTALKGVAGSSAASIVKERRWRKSVLTLGVDPIADVRVTARIERWRLEQGNDAGVGSGELLLRVLCYGTRIKSTEGRGWPEPRIRG
jgi:hypothetical protein